MQSKLDVINRILCERISEQEQSIGMVVAISNLAERHIVSYGKAGKENPKLITADSLFEIGSITKLFTALLFSEMAERNEIDPDALVRNYIPAEISLDKRFEAEATLTSLANHTSGLPRMPPNYMLGDPTNPFVDFNNDQLFRILSETSPSVGKLNYSNVGYGLLASILEQAAGADYSTLLRERLLEPLGMTNSMTQIPLDDLPRCALGHDLALDAVVKWDFGSLLGAGGVHSCGKDMLKFVEAVLGANSLSNAEAAATLVADSLSPEKVDLYWSTTKINQDNIFWKNGLTNGFSSFVGVLPASKIGVAVLSNVASRGGVSDIGFHLLNSDFPLNQHDSFQNFQIEDPNLLDVYVGRYRLEHNSLLEISRRGNRLFARRTGEVQHGIFPSTRQDFFFKSLDAEITFHIGDDGTCYGLTLHQDNNHSLALRV
ncbi:serine hydrolase [Rhizobium rhizogenes]|uniref:serine hydrolase n=1 Tax=Rhizobium rhizogenes TaxID=359 RepID=UPI00157446DB|nr:serine hydrolase [Rhizobium rhizogenes]NTG65161.1 serine hydrolase [Rhizobium rhizogenes]NTH68899.1 serine hydrolase [Rhizobium rhizogenes]NTI00363.1 serine hydrolase [Rhizobium rhizogenes]NTI39743.1 serine hydrolase [Rhizobium rhizogenes]NTJ18603.1 serine hydrolase [Rhizobium rhizogenes]